MKFKVGDKVQPSALWSKPGEGYKWVGSIIEGRSLFSGYEFYSIKNRGEYLWVSGEELTLTTTKQHEYDDYVLPASRYGYFPKAAEYDDYPKAEINSYVKSGENMYAPEYKRLKEEMEENLRVSSVKPTFVGTVARMNVNSDGGPSGYYDYPADWNTHNDYIEAKSKNQWKEHSFHLGNISKVLTRWGDKSGTTILYDTKKIIYSGCRILKAMVGTAKTREYLQSLLDDNQFKE